MFKLGIRRFALLMVAAILAFASCIKDIVKETNNGQAIDFRMAIDTRASELNSGNVNAFYVTAKGASRNIFTNVEFSKTNGIFSSSTAYYWPEEEQTIDFYAYAPSVSDIGGTISEDGLAITGITISNDVTKQTDFIVARQKVNKTPQTIPLHFEHKLSQIEIKAKNSNPAYTYSIKGIQLTGLSETADYSLAEDSWSNLQDAGTDAIAVDFVSTVIGSDPVNLMSGENAAMVIPQDLTKWTAENPTGAYIGVMAQIKTADGAIVFPRDGDYELMLIPISTKLQAGYKYIYTLDFTTGAGIDKDGNNILGKTITFDVNEIQWTGKSTSANLIGSWNLTKVETYRAWDEGNYNPNWPDHTIYLPSDEDFYTNPDKVPTETLRVRFIEDDVIYLFPGIPQYQTMGNYNVDGGYLYITVEMNETTGTAEYLLLDYGQDHFSIITNEDNTTYFMKKIFYYERDRDEFDLFEGKWDINSARYVLYSANNEAEEPRTFEWDSEDGLHQAMWSLNFYGNTVKFNTEEETTADVKTYDKGRAFYFSPDEEESILFYIQSYTLEGLTLSCEIPNEENGGRIAYYIEYKKSE